MKIKHYLYNAFTIEEGKTKIAIDPGCNMKLFHMKSLIPKNEWKSFSHILVTHGDPDHYVYADKIAMESGALLLCGKGLTKTVDSKNFILAPRRGGIKNWVAFDKVIPLKAGGKFEENDLSIEGIKTQHGAIYIPFLGLKIKKTPGPTERTGLGALGFKISLGGTTIVNLGDTLFREEWADLKPDVLMLPIGGLGNNTWTMDAIDALEAVKLIKPRRVIPCHYNVPFLFKKNAAPANEIAFKTKIEQLGIPCELMYCGDEINI